MNIHVAATR